MFGMTAVVFGLGAIPGAHATSLTPKEVVVAYADLDLSGAAGQSELKDRIRAAAATLCSPVLAIPPDAEPSVREHMVIYRACVGRLSERAMTKVKTARN
jgi:UrcA family protein